MNWKIPYLQAPIFAFDLDSTITRCELLPLLAESIGIGAQMAQLTESAMRDQCPFAESFYDRVEMLRGIPISKARSIIRNAPLNLHIADFVKKHADRCMIMTGNLDVWIEELLDRLNMRGRCMCSEAVCENDALLGIKSVLDKTLASRELKRPFVAIGDGSNDIGMLRVADFGIAFGGSRRISDDVKNAADIVICDEKELNKVLEKLI